MKNILDAIKSKRIYFDGAMGSMLQKYGLKSGELPETWNIEHPEIIEKIHRQYLSAGANVITTNTFGVNSLKHDNFEDLIVAAINCAKKAKKDFEDSYIAFDIGPIGKFLKPIGDLDFNDAIEIFSKSIKIASSCGVDLILIETMTDSYETKAAVIAAKECCSLPIFVTNVYDEYGKTLTGSDPEAMIALLEGLGVDAIGINCSLGPDKMIPLVKRYYEASSLPIICNPNAGLPQIIDGKAHYTLTAQEFSHYAISLAKNGANILGGCCGTNPEYIEALIQKTVNIPLNEVSEKDSTVISSYSHAINFGKKPLLIGERINPTGKPKFKQALIDGNINYILEQGLKQIDAGAQILDVNVGLPQIDEKSALLSTVSALQAICDTPLQLDSNDFKALEASMRAYNGKPMINSVNGDDESMDAIFPLIKKYGGVVVALTLDKNGFPKNADGRIKIAERIIAKAKEYGISSKDIIFDPLTMTVATNEKNADITLEAVKKLTEMGHKTVLGISNISFGMPERDTINVPFFANALSNGLTCAIMNPLSKSMMTVYKSYIDCADGKISLQDFNDLINKLRNENSYVNNAPSGDTTPNASLKDSIIKGILSNTVKKANELMQSASPIEIINNEIIPALNDVGNAFEKQEIYLPQLLKSAECASSAFDIIKENMPAFAESENSVILATVKGDIHDIGKNIVKLLLESYGFRVFDLGKDVSPQRILEEVKSKKCSFVALSALMTTTLPAMEQTISLLKGYNPNIKVMVGGAVLTEDYAKAMGADFYGKDALSAVRCVQEFYK